MAWKRPGQGWICLGVECQPREKLSKYCQTKTCFLPVEGRKALLSHSHVLSVLGGQGDGDAECRVLTFFIEA